MEGSKIPEATQKRSESFPFCFVFILFFTSQPVGLFFFFCMICTVIATVAAI